MRQVHRLRARSQRERDDVRAPCKAGGQRRGTPAGSRSDAVDQPCIRQCVEAALFHLELEERQAERDLVIRLARAAVRAGRPRMRDEGIQPRKRRTLAGRRRDVRRVGDRLRQSGLVRDDDLDREVAGGEVRSRQRCAGTGRRRTAGGGPGERPCIRLQHVGRRGDRIGANADGAACIELRVRRDERAGRRLLGRHRRAGLRAGIDAADRQRQTALVARLREERLGNRVPRNRVDRGRRARLRRDRGDRRSVRVDHVPRIGERPAGERGGRARRAEELLVAGRPIVGNVGTGRERRHVVRERRRDRRREIDVVRAERRVAVMRRHRERVLAASADRLRRQRAAVNRHECRRRDRRQIGADAPFRIVAAGVAVRRVIERVVRRRSACRRRSGTSFRPGCRT